MTPSIIGMWEENRPSPDNNALKKLADFFNVSVDYLLGRTDIITPGKQPKSDLSEQVALKLINKLEKDGYKITEEYLPNLILA